MKKFKLAITKFLINLIWNDSGGISRGGPGTNSIRDIVNNINSGGGVPADPVDSVQYHEPDGAFNGNADFRYIQGTGLLMGINTKVILDGNGGASEHYWVYNSTNDYTELFVDGAIRAQF